MRGFTPPGHKLLTLSLPYFVAEMRGFEPLVEFPLRQFSKLLLSTTQPHLPVERMLTHLLYRKSAFESSSIVV